MFDSGWVFFLITVVGGFFGLLVLLVLAVKAFYIKVEQGQALIVNTLA